MSERERKKEEGRKGDGSVEQRAIELIAGKAVWTGLIDSSAHDPGRIYNAVQGGDTRAVR